MNENKQKKLLKKYFKNEKNVKIFTEALHKLANDQESSAAHLYEVLCLRREGGSVKDCYQKLATRDFSLGAKTFEKFTRLEQEQDDFITKPAEVEEGVLECNCGSKRTISFTLQTRSGDEGTSVWARCVACGAKWRA